MKQYSQINIIHNNKQLHYMVEFHDAGIIEVTHGEYSYYTRAAEGIQFIRNTKLIDNFENNTIYNVVRNTNTWTIENRVFSNYYIPQTIAQRQLTLYIPRHSMESFYDKEFGDDHEMKLSGIKYVITAYTYIAGVKVVLGSYLFNLGSARAPKNKVRYKSSEYQLCIDFNVVDPVSLTYNDEWAPFRHEICGEPDFINNTGSIIHVDLDPVINGDDSIVRSSNFIGGITSIPFQRNSADYMHANLSFDGNATLNLSFNEIYENDLPLYLAETYDMWQRDPDTNELIIDPVTNNPIPMEYWVVYEVIFRDNDNVYAYHNKLVKYEDSIGAVFNKEEISKTWSWYKDGLFLQGSIELYTDDDIKSIESELDGLTDTEKVDVIHDTLEPTVDIISNEIPLNKENYKFLVPLTILPTGKNKINLKLVNMTEYKVDVVNKIHKNVINITRPEDYKSNVIKPVFIRAENIGNITIHPAVTENISINLNKYKSKVDLFYIRIEGVDFIEIGRTPQYVVFGIDGHLLPNEITEGIAYILDENHTLVTTGHYTYEQ